MNRNGSRTKQQVTDTLHRRAASTPEHILRSPKSTTNAPYFVPAAIKCANRVLATLFGKWEHATHMPVICHVTADEIPGCHGTYLPRCDDGDVTRREHGTILMRADLGPAQWFKTFVHEVRHWMQDTGGLLSAGYSMGLSADDMRSTVEEDADDFVERVLGQARSYAMLPALFTP